MAPLAELGEVEVIGRNRRGIYDRLSARQDRFACRRVTVDAGNDPVAQPVAGIQRHAATQQLGNRHLYLSPALGNVEQGCQHKTFIAE